MAVLYKSLVCRAKKESWGTLLSLRCFYVLSLFFFLVKCPQEHWRFFRFLSPDCPRQELSHKFGYPLKQLKGTLFQWVLEICLWLCARLWSSQHILFSGHYFCPSGAEQLQITFCWGYCLVGLWIRNLIFPSGFCIKFKKACRMSNPGWLATSHKFWISRVFCLNYKIYAEIS